MKINFIRLDHIQLTLPKGKEDEARKFYGEVLGLEETEKPDSLKKTGGVWYRIGDIELHLGAEDRIDTKRHPAFEIKDIHTVRKYLEDNGVKTKDETPIPGRERFTFTDPFGNKIEFLEYK